MIEKLRRRESIIALVFALLLVTVVFLDITFIRGGIFDDTRQKWNWGMTAAIVSIGLAALTHIAVSNFTGQFDTWKRVCYAIFIGVESLSFIALAIISILNYVNDFGYGALGGETLIFLLLIAFQLHLWRIDKFSPDYNENADDDYNLEQLNNRNRNQY